jgi:hypothetical protein
LLVGSFNASLKASTLFNALNAGLNAFACIGSYAFQHHVKKRKWDKFWRQYLLELRQIEAFNSRVTPEVLYLPLLNQRRVRA